MSPLAIACHEGQLLELLLSARADATAHKGNRWVTPPMSACETGEVECVRLCCARRVDRLRWRPLTDFNEPKTALEYAEASAAGRRGSALLRSRFATQGRARGRAADRVAEQVVQDQGGQHARRPQSKFRLMWMLRDGDLAYVNRWLRDGGRDLLDTNCPPGGKYVLTVAAGTGRAEGCSR